jgi:transcriptional regulator with XRE-family HTH domain
MDRAPRQLLPGRLRALRLDGGWRQQEVADGCLMQVRQYRRYENDEVRDITRADQHEHLDRIAGYFGVPFDSLFQGPAALPPLSDASLFVPDDAEVRKAQTQLRQPGSPVVIQGPRGFGKASLLDHLLGEVTREEPQVRICRVDLGGLSEDETASLGALLRTIASRLAQSLAGERCDDLVARAWQRPSTDKGRLGWLMEHHLLPATQRLCLVLERVEYAEEWPHRTDLFALLRSWLDKRLEQSPWATLRILCTVSTEAALLERTDHSSFFALSATIRLDGLSREQLATLAARHPRLRSEEDSQEALRALTGGHPALCRLALYEAASAQKSLGQVLDAGAVFGPHLLRLRRWLEERRLLGAIAQVLADGTLALDDYCRLYSQGLVVEGSPGRYRLRCSLYESYFAALCQRPAP